MTNPFQILDARLSSIESLLLDLQHKSNFPDPSQQQGRDELLTIKEAAEHVSLKVPTIYALVAQNSIPYSKKGKRLYFSKTELTEWVKSGRKKTNEEIQAEAEAELAALRRRGR